MKTTQLLRIGSLGWRQVTAYPEPIVIDSSELIGPLLIDGKEVPLD